MPTSHAFIGKWITSSEFRSLEPLNVFHRQLQPIQIENKAPQNAHILFRRRFTAKKAVPTVICLSADDYYKLYINGRFVCQGPAAGYPFHYYYNRVDITDYLIDGENTLAVHTYYQGLVNRVWVSGDDRHGFICDIEQDGQTILSSDESFLYAYHTGFEAMGTYGYATQFAERYRSASPEEGFEQPSFDDTAWKSAHVREHLDYTLFEQPTAMLEFEDIRPLSEVWDENGVTVDFGSTYVGYLCATAVGVPGQTLELLFGQELNEDGSVRWKLRANCEYREEWVLSGQTDVLNEFDYKSFRYVRINMPGGRVAFEKASLYLRARHYPFELKAKPNVSDPKLLAIWDLCVRSLKYGPQEVIQDCMEREKGNYLGDGCYTALAHAVLTGDVSQIKKLVDDSMRSRFIDKGLMTCAACSFMQEIAEYPLMMYYLLYSYYELTGDTDYLREKYDGLCEILDHYRDTYETDGLLTNLDKWCVVEWPAPYRDGYAADITEGKVCTEVHSVINAHYIGAVKYLNRIAALLGKAPYRDEAPLVKAYTDAFYVSEKRLFRDNVNSDHISMVSNAFAFMYDLAPDGETEETMVRYFKERGFTTVMLFGAYPILEGLRRTGRLDVMYEFLADENAWLRMLREGATVTFEGWGRDAKWNTSLFHLTLSYASLFLTDRGAEAAQQISRA